MSRAARPRPNPVWLLVVVLMVGLALAGPVIIVLGAAPATAAAAGGGGGAGGTVRMVGPAFAPGTLTVARGAKVVFDNDDTAPHTVTARSGGSTRA